MKADKCLGFNGLGFSGVEFRNCPLVFLSIPNRVMKPQITLNPKPLTPKPLNP